MAAAADSRSSDDLLQPFLLESSGIRGNVVRLGPVVHEILTRHAYPAPVARLLGEMLTLTAMLAGLIKHDGIFSLQTKGNGPVGTMIADITSGGDLRGYAAFDEDRVSAMAGASSVPGLLGTGYLAFTADPGPPADRYQGIVELTGETLAECLQHYFRQSEQVQSGLFAATSCVDETWRAAGLVLQRLPEDGPAHGSPVDEDAWRRAMVLQASCTRSELLDPDLPVNDLLYRLFHEEGVRVFRRRAVRAGCRCSRARLENTLRALPRQEVEDLRVDGEVVVTCEFCNRRYEFDTGALVRIYAP
ncbi:MAG: Hsp33 family molecular chaperone HslO [Alphaproteobacteria bacterium]